MPEASSVGELIAAFPAIFKQAQADWAKYKVALAAGQMPPEKEQQVLDWFWEFPRLWEGIRPHFEYGTPSSPASPERKELAQEVNRWIIRLRGEPQFENKVKGLGFATVIIIAGIAVAAAFGVAGVTWAIGYVQKQKNISRILDAVTQGKVPPDILRTAIEEEQGGTFFGELAGDLKQVLVVAGLGILALMFAPQIMSAIKSVGKR